MSRKLVLTTFFITVLIGMLGLSFKVQRVMASGTIYIRADGSVDPSTVSIQRNGNTYIFIGNINDSVVVERDNIVVDGAGYTIQGAGSWAGIDLAGRSNVTIKNAIIKGFRYGIDLDDSSHNSIFGNNITGNRRDGISLGGSSYNSIFNNSVIENDEDGIDLNSFSNHNNIYGNHLIENDFDGIAVGNSSYNKVYENNITENDEDGIDLSKSSYNSIFGNNITANWFDGIDIGYSSNHNNIYGNNIADNDDDGIDLYQSSNNNIYENNITANWWDGIELYSSTNNSIFGNQIKGNYPGIYLVTSSDNTITRNNMTRNYPGIQFRESSNNTLYHNNFVNNSRQVYDESWDNPEIPSSVNVWDDGYPSGGNYRSDYVSLDLHSGSNQDETGSDGIGDTGYEVDADNKDCYPLMALFTPFDAGTWNKKSYNVDVVSNSTVADFQFNPNEGAFLKFNVTGEDSTKGFCRISIPKSLLWVDDGWTIHVGGEPITDYKIIPDENHTYLYFTYNHTTKTVLIQGTHVIPEFPSFLILPLFILATLLTVLICRRKHLK